MEGPSYGLCTKVESFVGEWEETSLSYLEAQKATWVRKSDNKVVVTVCKGECCRYGKDYKPLLPTPEQLKRMAELAKHSSKGYLTVKDEREYTASIAVYMAEGT